MGPESYDQDTLSNYYASSLYYPQSFGYGQNPGLFLGQPNQSYFYYQNHQPTLNDYLSASGYQGIVN